MDIADDNGYVLNLKVTKPSLENNTADVERIKQALKDNFKINNIKICFDIIKKIPHILRESNHEIKAVIFRDLAGWILVDIAKEDKDQLFLGVAADIGTTRVVIRIVDLESKQVLIEKGFDNPQITIGPDVLSRIHYAKDQKGLEELSYLLIQGFNSNISDLCKKIDRKAEDIYLFSGAGNTSMTHLFLGVEPSGIIREPYIPCINIPDTLKADKVGLNLNPNAVCFLFPNIGSYFGGDLISGILYCNLNKLEKPCIMVDVGTNAEVVVGCKDWLVACAGAAGPALEGGVSDIGMIAAPGVIDKVSINKDTNKLEFTTIENKTPVGICGSGMIDLAAALFLSKKIDIRGKFIKTNCNGRLFNKYDIDYFIIVDKEDSGTGDNICISQVDLNSLTSSKAAMYTILEVIVCNTAGLSFDDLAKFYVAGTFGSFINPESAISIGMLPDIKRDKFEVLGNSSLGGATKLLIDRAAFDEAGKIRKSITYIELNVNAEFMNMFSGAKFYPHTDKSRFPSVPV
ncbi:MAG: DUF4445 domain-containing protein [Desulfobacterales bacterium]|nr:DUF4445 domain-containing protein [Desulfobacterales bacterium]